MVGGSMRVMTTVLRTAPRASEIESFPHPQDHGSNWAKRATTDQSSVVGCNTCASAQLGSLD